jgi:hypothetical protein
MPAWNYQHSGQRMPFGSKGQDIQRACMHRFLLSPTKRNEKFFFNIVGNIAGISSAQELQAP